MAIIRCFRCKGKGEITDGVVKACAALTLGLLSPLIFALKDTCPVCGGRGYLDEEKGRLT